MFFFSEFDEITDSRRTIRDRRIDTIEDLETYQNNYPTRDAQRPYIRYIEEPTVLALPQLNPFLFKYSEKTNILLTSSLQPEDLQASHIICIGNFRFLSILDQYFLHSPFDYEYFPQAKLLYQPQDSDSLIVYQKTGSVIDYHIDHAIVAKLPGPNNNCIFLFTSLYSSASLQVLKEFTIPKTLKRIEQLIQAEIGFIPDHFEILFKVRGLARRGLDSEVLLIRKVPSDKQIWTPQP
jgi:hypothetical protein